MRDLQLIILCITIFKLLCIIECKKREAGNYYQGKWSQYVHSYPLAGTDNDPMMSPIYRHSDFLHELVSNFESRLESTYEIYTHGLLRSNNSFLYGRRYNELLFHNDPISRFAELPKEKSLNLFSKKANQVQFEWYRYSSVLTLARYVGSGLLSLPDSLPFIDHSPDIKKPIRIVSLLSKNRLEWSLLDAACSTYGIVISPIYDSLGEDGISYSINLVQSKTIVVSFEVISTILRSLHRIPKIRYVIVLRPENTSKVGAHLDFSIDQNKLIIHGETINLEDYPDLPRHVEFLSFESIVELGSKNLHLPTPSLYEDINSIYFTSGTTGTSKGVIQTNGIWIAGSAGPLRSFLSRSDSNLSPKDTYLSFLPLAHIFERLVHLILIYSGAKIGFYNGNILNLGEDLQSLHPTVFVSVPRLFTKLYKGRVLPEIRKKGKLTQNFFFSILNRKKRSRNPVVNSVYDFLVFNRISNLLGGRIRFTLSGAAPLEDSMQRDMRAMLKSQIVQGFGTTEALATFCPEFTDLTVNNIGGPIPSVEFRLLSVPEMGYDVRTFPRQGELLLRGPTIFKGYLKQPNKTNEAIDTEGWLHTGDIAELLDNGAVRIIDRRKHLFKLSQGEYISPESIENIYSTHSPFIAQIFITAKSTEPVIMAIIVPDPDYVKAWLLGQGVKINDWETQYNYICQQANLNYYKLKEDTLLRQGIMNSLKKVERDNNIAGLKRINNFHLECDGFTIENGLLTPTAKLMRFKLRKQYETEINHLYNIYHEDQG
ncbi:long-chain fatty acid CoA ligase, putative [Cryptosporidium muris RN66]|uniref:Long-chain fatty acid CoA ligase, putative n=1 Tax=Cryptosporidium muris (strain RN66) TaxID=441375 RepID=B6AD94_CRYMR|nr:long-chain fatty acid CoA ligase, putative [Cryptosporidium muris RN66]EEA06098.1 long-chain fatty acid CoA ligase, putative [Cryptosporidium muris RN66]|eukprot:XP_002140447.1 long-chain fatty acid CoA ligase [Cryptosporidium muris RN66]